MYLCNCKSPFFLKGRHSMSHPPTAKRLGRPRPRNDFRLLSHPQNKVHVFLPGPDRAGRHFQDHPRSRLRLGDGDQAEVLRHSALCHCHECPQNRIPFRRIRVWKPLPVPGMLTTSKERQFLLHPVFKGRFY